MLSADPTTEKKGGESRIILLLQYMLPVSFTAAMLGVITWIVSLIRLSRRLHDVPSASVGISIVAIPIFLLMLIVFWYVFIGIMSDREESDADASETGGVQGV